MQGAAAVGHAFVKTQRLLSRAVRDMFAVMGVVRRFAVAGLDEAAGKTGRRRGLAAGAIDETGQVKAGTRTAGVKRQYLPGPGVGSYREQ